MDARSKFRTLDDFLDHIELGSNKDFEDFMKEYKLNCKPYEVFGSNAVLAVNMAIEIMCAIASNPQCTERRNGTASLFVGLHGDYNGIKEAQKWGGMTLVHVVVVKNSRNVVWQSKNKSKGDV